MAKYDGTDATRSVWITLDERGRLDNLEISRTWRTRMGVAALPNAIYESYAAAMADRVTELSDQLDQRNPLRHKNIRIGDDWEKDARAAVEEASAVLTAARTPRVENVREYRGLFGYLTLHVRDGVVVSITGDPAALAKGNPGLLRDDAFEAFRSANLTTQN